MTFAAQLQESAERLDRMGRMAARVMADLRDNADPGENDPPENVASMQDAIDEARRCLDRAEKHLIEARECTDRVTANVNECIEVLGGTV